MLYLVNEVLRKPCKHKCGVYNASQSDGTLDEHVAEIDHQAEEMFERLVKQIAMRQGITEQLKADDQRTWVSAMNRFCQGLCAKKDAVSE